ncbi:MAG: hypothetical protein IPK46_11085 [Saprospiraceae bacterium]|nr:hypothetical protein [Saprospiraceae bacterium]
MNKFSKIVANELKYYVYLYLHPTTREVFYVGKGKEIGCLTTYMRKVNRKSAAHPRAEICGLKS